MRRTLLATAVLVLTLLPAAGTLAAGDVTRIPLRIDAPDGTPADLPLPVTGGIPFPRGELPDAGHVRLLAGSDEVPAQFVRTAVWPDGSVKWVRLDAVLPLAKGRRLRVEFGPGVRRAEYEGGIAATVKAAGVKVTADGLSAVVSAKSGGIESLRIGGKKVLADAHLVLEALRVAGPDAFPWGSRVCADIDAKPIRGEVVVTETKLELPGPVRARVLLRGYVKMPGLGDGLPDRVKKLDPPGRLPFSLRFDFVSGVPVVLGETQLVYTGEPDRDFITRWELTLPGLGAGTTRRTMEPGVTVDRDGRGRAARESRLCRAPIRGGLALIRAGWENRPCLVGGAGKDARIAFWPAEEGPWDLRRFAREWSVGETGNRDRPVDMQRYARYAARGLAKSHSFALWFGEGGPDDVARALSGPALLVAPPGWYARTGALGAFAPEEPGGRFSGLDEGVRRYLDWFRFNQDLYRWHGKLDYGFWQTRNGDIHRHDRWDRDYGRWGWSLGDGAGRIGHTLMLTYLRTLERRYLVAGEAYCRAVFDTSMVHTETHLENATSSWWRVRGLNHRHNVQPFGCPYIGMRGSYPGGHRILRHLAGGGVIGDGLDLTAETALAYATDRPGAFGASGGPDGQAAGANALLYGYETTGDDRYLVACRKLLTKSGILSGKPVRLSYAPSFGLFLAAEEYVALTGDEEIARGLVSLADRALAEKDPAKLLTPLAFAARTTGKAKYRKALEQVLAKLDFTGSLAELPAPRRPGHGGPRRPPSRGNVGRDLPYAIAALTEPPAKDDWPRGLPDPVSVPARAPDDWFRPGGHAERRDRAPAPKKLLRGRKPREAPYETFLLLARRDKAGNAILTEERAADAVSVTAVKIDGRPAERVAVAVDPPRGSHVAGFGFRIPLPLSGNGRWTHVTAPGSFRLERWLLDQRGEQIPGWLNSDSRTRWPLWRGGGILLLPDGAYRIFKQNRIDTSPLFVDQGVGSPGWLDLTDRGGKEHWGVTVRPLSGSNEECVRSVRVDVAGKRLVVAFHSPAGAPLPASAGPFSGAADVIRHDGWRPPLEPPDLTREQFAKFLDDLDYGGNIGLFALRFLLAPDHRVPPGPWKQRLADTGVEPRELLLSMQWKGGLEKHCERLGARFDPKSPDASARNVIQIYRKR